MIIALIVIAQIMGALAAWFIYAISGFSAACATYVVVGSGTMFLTAGLIFAADIFRRAAGRIWREL